MATRASSTRPAKPLSSHRPDLYSCACGRRSGPADDQLPGRANMLVCDRSPADLMRNEAPGLDGDLVDRLMDSAHGRLKQPQPFEIVERQKGHLFGNLDAA